MRISESGDYLVRVYNGQPADDVVSNTSFATVDVQGGL